MRTPVRNSLLLAISVFVPCIGASAAGPVTMACPAVATRVGATYSSTLAGYGGTYPYTFSLTSGSLPPGLTLTGPGGAIAGTPTSGGAFTFTSEMADASGNTLAGQCTITVVTTPVTPACPASTGQLTVFYTSALVATGGVPPYTIFVSGGVLPPGIATSAGGSFGGTPTSPGTFSFTGEVEDSTGTAAGTATITCSIAIGEPQKAGSHNNVTGYSFPAPVNNAIAIAAGPDGALWFTELRTNAIGRITTAGVITQYKLPFATGPEDITAGPDGALWFTEAKSAIGRITTAGSITEYPTSGPAYAITVGPDGAFWFTYGGSIIGRMTTAGAATEYWTGAGTSSGPGTITAGPDGALWFTDTDSNAIWRMTTAGVAAKYPLPTGIADPAAITAGPDGALWFTENIANKIGRITTAGGITEYDVPTANSDPWKIVAGPDGALWFTEYGGGKIGRITTAGAITEYPLPNAQSVPTGITAARDKALWFTEYVSPSKIARITTAGLITEYPVPEVTEAWRIAAGPDGALWFTGNFSAEIGRAPDCGLGFSASFANSTLTMNFNLGIDTPATFNILLHTKAGAQEPYSKAIPAVAPPQAFTLTWSAFPDLGDMIVEPTLAAQPGGSGLGLCSEWTTVNTAR